MNDPHDPHDSHPYTQIRDPNVLQRALAKEWKMRRERIEEIEERGRVIRRLTKHIRTSLDQLDPLTRKRAERLLDAYEDWYRERELSLNVNQKTPNLRNQPDDHPALRTDAPWPRRNRNPQ